MKYIWSRRNSSKVETWEWEWEWERRALQKHRYFPNCWNAQEHLRRYKSQTRNENKCRLAENRNRTIAMTWKKSDKIDSAQMDMITHNGEDVYDRMALKINLSTTSNTSHADIGKKSPTILLLPLCVSHRGTSLVSMRWTNVMSHTYKEVKKENAQKEYIEKTLPYYEFTQKIGLSHFP